MCPQDHSRAGSLTLGTDEIEQERAFRSLAEVAITRGSGERASPVRGLGAVRL